MTDHTIDLVDRPLADDVNAVVRGLIGFNDGVVGPEGWRQLALFLRDGEGGIAGGLLGFTHWEWLFVSHLWVDASLRRRGYGRELMQRAEVEARARGCLHAHLDTFGFQARGFYEALGYEVFGQLDGYPAGHTRYFLRKYDLS